MKLNNLNTHSICHSRRYECKAPIVKHKITKKSVIIIDLFLGCKTSSGPKSGELCIFPFLYKNVAYNGCTDVENKGVPWCSVKVYNNGSHVDGEWGNCGSNCLGKMFD